jgi:pimeloyl-ACP methyl ester carboxylesterase
LKLDSEAALKYLLSRDDLDGTKIIAFGRSLGGAVAIDIAATYPKHVSALIVENTFTSILDMVDVLFPVLSFFKPLCLNPYVLFRLRVLTIQLAKFGYNTKSVPASALFERRQR